MQLKEYQAFEALPEHCRSLVTHASSNNLFLSDAWFANLTDTGLEENARVLILSVEDVQSTMCYALLMLRSPAGQNGSRFSSWNMRANTLASLTNFQSSFFNLMLDDEAADLEIVCRTMTAGLQKSPAKWHLIDLNLLDPDSRVYSTLKSALSDSGYVCDTYMYKGNWYEKLQCSNFADYIKTREKSNRKSIQNYQRKFRKLEKEERIKAVFFKGNDSLATVLQVYDEIYLSSWKEGDFFPSFYHGLIRHSAENGSLRMAIIYLDSKPAAFELAIVTGCQCVMMRTAYVAEFARDSLGSIAILSMIEYVIEQDGVTEIDFGTDDDVYKSTWVNQRRERFGLVAFNKRTIFGRYYWCLYALRKLSNSLIGIARKTFIVKPTPGSG